MKATPVLFCRKAAVQTRPLREIFDEETAESDVAAEVAFGTMEPTMQRAAKLARPLNLTTVDAVINAAQTQNMSFFKGMCVFQDEAIINLPG